MKYHIATISNLHREILFNQLRYLIERFDALGVEAVITQFGFAWGMEFNNWNELEIKPRDIIPLVEFVENRHYGQLGGDDLLIQPKRPKSRIDILFCHHGDIEITFIEKDEFVDSLYEHFKRADLNPRVFVEPAGNARELKEISLNEII